MTCNICGTGYRVEDILIYGCYMCGKGFKDNMVRTKNRIIKKSQYCSPKLRYKLYLRHGIPPDVAVRGLESTQTPKNLIDREMG